jgi:L-iditol 2-dehydrogenase
LKAGETVAVWGAGPAGTLLSRAARAHGAEPVNVDPDPTRQAEVGGCERCPDRAFDVCVVAVGAKAAYAEALEHLRPRGRLVVFSGLPPGGDHVEVDLNRLHYHEQTLVGAYGCAYRHGVAALNLIAGGAVATADLVSHRLPLGRLEEALDLVATRRCMKIVLVPRGDGAE